MAESGRLGDRSRLIIFCISQFIQKFVIEPVQELKKTISEIGFRLDYYTDAYPSTPDLNDENQRKEVLDIFNGLRESSCRLYSDARAILCYDLFEAMRWIPTRSELEKAKSNLMYVSNTKFMTDRHERWERRQQINEVKNLLHLDK